MDRDLIFKLIGEGTVLILVIGFLALILMTCLKILNPNFYIFLTQM